MAPLPASNATATQRGRPRKLDFLDDLAPMVYGFAGDATPVKETIALLNDVVLEYVSRVALEAARVAKVQGDGGGLSVEAFEFVVRKDARKRQRIAELLQLHAEIKKVRDTAFSNSKEKHSVPSSAAGRSATTSEGKSSSIQQGKNLTTKRQKEKEKKKKRLAAVAISPSETSQAGSARKPDQGKITSSSVKKQKLASDPTRPTSSASATSAFADDGASPLPTSEIPVTGIDMSDPAWSDFAVAMPSAAKILNEEPKVEKVEQASGGGVAMV